MRSWKSLLTVAIVLGGTSAMGIAGCSSDAVPIDDDSGSPAVDSSTPPKDSATPPKDSATADTATPPKDSATPDTATADTSTPDAPADVRPDTTDAFSPDVRDAADAADASGPKPPGSACAPVNSVYEMSCGFCGKSTQLCEATGWSAVGACVGENTSPDRCMAGSPSTTEACGLCGRRTITCQPNCTKAQGVCTGEVAGGCIPGTKEFNTVGCPTPGEGRERTCDATCMWGAFGACIARPSDVTVPAAVGGLGSVDLLFETAKTLPRLVDGACPTTLSATATAYVYGRVRNTLAQTAKVSLWTTVPVGAATDPDTIIGVYAGAADPANRLACVGVVNDDCTAPPAAPAGMCVDGGAGLLGADAATIAPGATITVYLGQYFNPAIASQGPIRLNVRTDSLL